MAFAVVQLGANGRWDPVAIWVVKAPWVVIGKQEHRTTLLSVTRMVDGSAGQSEVVARWAAGSYIALEHCGTDVILKRQSTPKGETRNKPDTTTPRAAQSFFVQARRPLRESKSLASNAPDDVSRLLRQASENMD